MADENAQSTRLERLHKKQQDKFHAIYKQANRWRKRFGEPAGNPVAGMLGEFHDFLCNYWYFLYDPDDAAAPALSLEIVRDLSVALAIVNNQWTTISRACEQRMDADLTGVMVQIDEQAHEYYGRFIGYKRGDLPIVYFDKVAAISRSDFTGYPLLSIPFCDIDPKTQSVRAILPTVRWESSLAHELGHFIYWNSLKYTQFNVAHKNLRRAIMQEFITRYAKKDDLEDIRKGISLVDIWSRWLEEAFADICGTLIEGPDYAESALDMAEEARPELSAFDDGEHPLPYLRPLVAIEALKWVAKRQDVGNAQRDWLNGRIQQFKEQWERTWVKQSANAQVRTRPIVLPEGGRFVTGTDIEESIPLVVVTVLGRTTSAGVSKSPRRGAVAANWYDPDQEVYLGELFDYYSWLEGAEGESQSARRAKGSSLSVSASGFSGRVPVKRCEQSDMFNSLIDELAQKIISAPKIIDNSDGEQLSDEEIRKRLRPDLLSLGLEVRGVGKGGSFKAMVRNVEPGECGSLERA